MPEDADAVADEELVRRIRAGDERAAKLLFDRHEPLLRRRARRRLLGGLRRRLGESDVVQETYLATFEGIEAFEDRGPGSFRRWLTGVLENTANDQIKRHLHAEKRSAKRDVSPTPGASHSGPACTAPSPGSQLVRDEELDALRRALDAMEGDDRRVLDLVYREGKDFAEAGRAMERSAEAARKLYGRAVMRLADIVRHSP